MTLSKLPSNPEDGDQILDNYGNRYQYNKTANSWISQGHITPPPTATEEQDGLVDPETYQKIQQIKTIYESGQYKFEPLKILPGTTAYWYYFKSSDKAYKITPESATKLRIEIDKEYLYRSFKRSICPGPQGPNGKEGKQGITGTAGAAEPCYQPTIEYNKLTFAIYTPTPINTNIIIRLHQTAQPSSLTSQLQYHSTQYTDINYQQLKDKIQKQNLNNLKTGIPPLSKVYTGTQTTAEPAYIIEIDTNGNIISTTNNGLTNLNESETLKTITIDTGVVYGSIILNDDWTGNWCVKSRQKGPPGDKGEDGDCTLNIIDTIIDNTNIIATCPIINLRLANNTILWKCADVLNDIIVTSISLRAGATSLNNLSSTESIFAAAQMTLDDAKSIHRYTPSIEADEIEDPEFVHWEPQPGCISRRNYNRHKFNWVNNTINPACNDIVKWYSPDALRNTRFPTDIITQQPPAQDECCQEDFFYLPNIQRNACPSPVPAAADSPQLSLPNSQGRSLQFGNNNYDI